MTAVARQTTLSLGMPGWSNPQEQGWRQQPHRVPHTSLLQPLTHLLGQPLVISCLTVPHGPQAVPISQINNTCSLKQMLSQYIKSPCPPDGKPEPPAINLSFPGHHLQLDETASGCFPFTVWATACLGCNRETQPKNPATNPGKTCPSSREARPDRNQDGDE